MKKISLIFISFLLILTTASAQWLTEAQRDSIQQLNRADHQLMMRKLGLTEMRPGPGGDPKSPNAASADESKVKNYESLPDPLVFENGKPSSGRCQGHVFGWCLRQPGLRIVGRKRYGNHRISAVGDGVDSG